MRASYHLPVLILAAASASAAVIEVPADVATITEALSIAQPGDQVLVATGTYPEGSFFMAPGVTLTGSGAAATVVDATGEAVGIRIQQIGDAVIEGLSVRGTGGPGMRVHESSVTIRDCHLIENETNGLLVTGNSPSLVQRCLIADNGDDGIGILGDGVQVLECEVIDNGLIGISVESGAADILNCEVAGHGRNGLYLAGTGGTVRGCVIRENGDETWGLGGIRVDGVGWTIEHCVVSRNLATADGGGIMLFGPGCTIRSCTIVANRTLPGWTVGGIAFFAPPAAFERNIVAFSEVGAGVGCFGVDFTFVCCNIYGNAGGDAFCQPSQNGLQLDPLFCDLETGDYTLHIQSPCAEGNHPNSPDCGLIGALDVGCGATPARKATWGGIKSLYQ